MRLHLLAVIVLPLVGLVGCAQRDASEPVTSTHNRPKNGSQPAPVPSPQPSPSQVLTVEPQKRVPQPVMQQREGDYVKQRQGTAAATAHGDLAMTSVNARPTPFHAATFARDPSAYLDVVQPSRVWDVATPGPNVAPLTAISDTARTIPALGSVRLQVQTAPLFPVSFFSYDLGVFANNLAAITVRADSQGVASAVWTATAGTTGLTRIHVGSPGASGNVLFNITVREPIPAVAVPIPTDGAPIPAPTASSATTPTASSATTPSITR